MAEIVPDPGAMVYCDHFQGIERFLSDLHMVTELLGSKVNKGVSSMEGVQLADVTKGTTRRFLSTQNGERYDRPSSKHAVAGRYPAPTTFPPGPNGGQAPIAVKP